MSFSINFNKFKPWKLIKDKENTDEYDVYGHKRPVWKFNNSSAAIKPNDYSHEYNNYNERKPTLSYQQVITDLKNGAKLVFNYGRQNLPDNKFSWLKNHHGGYDDNNNYYNNDNNYNHDSTFKHGDNNNFYKSLDKKFEPHFAKHQNPLTPNKVSFAKITEYRYGFK